MNNKVVSISNGEYADGEKKVQRLFALTEDGKLYVLMSKVISGDPFANFPVRSVWKQVNTNEMWDGEKAA